MAGYPGAVCNYNYPCPSLDTAFWKAGPISHWWEPKNKSCALTWRQRYGRATHLLLGGVGVEVVLPTLAVEKTAHRVMSSGELALSLTASYGTWESGPGFLPDQLTELCWWLGLPVSQPRGRELGRAGPATQSAVRWCGCGCPPHLPLSPCSSWETCP